ncbi:hypothetical protein [Paludibacter sp.]|uniref:nSTAND3 domain-containing NTPase n=1 Tax=Paludibacter sp. TaxID=1898105 RepID=UPI0013531037|nr:hypothetical protein [Paludibacter sp.]MTK53883.1 AAA family ATPase [Paludibacter sp.]
MIKVVEIENALAQINGDIFQEFCNHFLYLKLNPNTITPIGSVIGKEKSRKGIPDSYFTVNKELIFAEYTTRERTQKGQSFYAKLKSDIENCFDMSKTGLKKEEIDKVILCFTGRIKPEEKKTLEELCKQHNPKCILDLKGIRDLAFAVLDYPILGTYVGIKVGTGQIQEPSAFIVNYEKSKISTPLSNTFYGRETEIEDGLNSLNNNDLLLIHGAPGTGKSKFAIELAKLYADKNGFSFLCIGNRDLPIWDDIKEIIRIDKNYVLLVDDANRLAKNFQWILSLYEDRKPNSFKVVVTVRDYAFNFVKSIALNYSFSTIEIKTFSDDELKKIIQSDDFEITEPSYIERILKIAKGNARLAIMSAKVARTAANLLELYDASQIYDEYFESLFNEIELLKEPITQKVLALISFFSRIDRENRKLCDYIFERLNIEEAKFWEICYSLHETELVDLFEQQIVKISDQIFSTYIFYKAVIENKVLSFSFFLNNYLDYKNRINDTIIPVINTFNYKHIETILKPEILKHWLVIEKESNDQDLLKYFDLFWFYLAPQVFVFIKRQIDKQDTTEVSEYRFRYELNEFSYGTGIDLEILSRFKNHSDEFFKDSLELMFYYAIKDPSKMPAVIYICKERFNFSRLGYEYGDRIQHLLFDFLITNAQTSQNKIIYENVLAEILPDFLKIEHREDESNGRTFTFYTFHLWLSESVKAFRIKCFDYLLQCGNKSIVLQTLYRLSYYEYQYSKEILEHDLSFIYQIISKYFDPNEFKDCFVLQNIMEGLDWLNVDYKKGIQDKYNSKLFLLAEILKTDKQRRKEIGWEEEDRLHQVELKKYCDKFKIDDYRSLFYHVSTILEHVKEIGVANNVTHQYESSLNTIIGHLAQSDVWLFLKVLELNFTKFNFNLHFGYIFARFFQANPESYLALFELIQDLDENKKFYFHQALIIDEVKSEHLSLLYADLLDTINSLKSQYIFWDLTFASKYKELKEERDIYSEILGLVLWKRQNEQINIGVGQLFFEKCLSFSDFSFENLIEVYLYSNDIEQHFDYEKKILRALLEHDSLIITRILKFNSPDKYSRYDFEHYDFVWDLDNYLEIMNSIFEYFTTNNIYYFSGGIITAFFPNVKNKYAGRPIEYLESLIDKNNMNESYMCIVFRITCYKYPELKMLFLKKFLTLNDNFEIFKSLEVVKRSKSWSGSYIPILEGEKDTWKNVISVLDRLPNRLNYHEHKEYVSRQIGYCDLRIKDELKREFYEDFN